jgi:DNA-binding NarL/FixJ family response regulator
VLNAVHDLQERSIGVVLVDNHPVWRRALADYLRSGGTDAIEGLAEVVAVVVLTWNEEDVQPALRGRGAREHPCQTMSLQDLFRHVLLLTHRGRLPGNFSWPMSQQRGWQRLSHREEEVLRLLLTGYRNVDIAAELTISVHTVEYHISRLFAKLGARSRWELIARARRSADEAWF